MEAAAKKVLAELKVQNLPLVGLINNAGVAQKFPLEFHPLKDLRAMFDVRFWGCGDGVVEWIGWSILGSSVLEW